MDTVSVSTESFWQEQGWQKEELSPGSEKFTGKYKIEFDSIPHEFDGIIIIRRLPEADLGEPGKWPSRVFVDVFVKSPPNALKLHLQGRCFEKVKDDWRHVHYITPPTNADDAIMHVQRIFFESFEKEKSKIERQKQDIQKGITKLNLPTE